MTGNDSDGRERSFDSSVEAWRKTSLRSPYAQRSGAGSLSPLLERSEVLRSEAVRATVQLLVAERCALAASAGLVNAAGVQRTKIYMATQVLDAAYHAELLSRQLAVLGIEEPELNDAIATHANPDLLSLAETVLRPIAEGDFIVGMIGQNLVLAEILLACCELLEALNRFVDPQFADTLAAIMENHRRHLAFGNQALDGLVKRHPEKKAQIVELATDLSRLMILAFADLFRDNPTLDEIKRLGTDVACDPPPRWHDIDLLDAPEGVIERTVISVIAGRLKKRLGSLGMGYRRPTPLDAR